MPSTDYSNVVGGGLKLKGIKSGGIDKKKKKKKPKTDKPTDEEAGAEQNAIQKALKDEDNARQGADSDKVDEEEPTDLGKTEAQKRHDEHRRKRLDERLKREGVKTHKERVEALNKYLSGMSEHHDMPRIGPG